MTFGCQAMILLLRACYALFSANVPYCGSFSVDNVISDSSPPPPFQLFLTSMINIAIRDDYSGPHFGEYGISLLLPLELVWFLERVHEVKLFSNRLISAQC